MVVTLRMVAHTHPPVFSYRHESQFECLDKNKCNHQQFLCYCKELWDNIIASPFIKDGLPYMLNEIGKEALKHLSFHLARQLYFQNHDHERIHLTRLQVKRLQPKTTVVRTGQCPTRNCIIHDVGERWNRTMVRQKPAKYF